MCTEKYYFYFFIHIYIYIFFLYVNFNINLQNDLAFVCIKIRTLRDGFGADVLEEKVMLCLLDEELRAYKESTRDTAQERYNTLCDLLDICQEESAYRHLRAVYLCEMAQVVCFQDFSEQTDW